MTDSPCLLQKCPNYKGLVQLVDEKQRDIEELAQRLATESFLADEARSHSKQGKNKQRKPAVSDCVVKPVGFQND